MNLYTNYRRPPLTIPARNKPQTNRLRTRFYLTRFCNKQFGTKYKLFPEYTWVFKPRFTWGGDHNQEKQNPNTPTNGPCQHSAAASLRGIDVNTAAAAHDELSGGRTEQAAEGCGRPFQRRLGLRGGNDWESGTKGSGDSVRFSAPAAAWFCPCDPCGSCVWPPAGKQSRPEPQ